MTNEITVTPNADAYDCLADAAESYIDEHPMLRGYDLAPRWTDDQRETVALSVPGWFLKLLTDTSGT